MARQVSAGLLLFAASLLGGHASAAPIEVGKPFQPQVAQMRADVNKCEKCSESSQQERAKVAALARSGAVLEAQHDIKALQPDQRTAVRNDQEPVTRILTEAGEDSRLIAGASVPLVRR